MIQMRNNLVAIKKLGKQSGNKGGNLDGLLHMPEVADSQGIIKGTGPEAASDLKPGLKVYYGEKRTQIRMNGEDVLVMEDNNIYAIVDEESSSEETKEA